MKNPVLPSPIKAEAEKHIKGYLRLAPGRMKTAFVLFFNPVCLFQDFK